VHQIKVDDHGGERHAYERPSSHQLRLLYLPLALQPLGLVLAPLVRLVFFQGQLLALLL
jgi:hypothetical protein